jgi:hypothetical protein
MEEKRYSDSNFVTRSESYRSSLSEATKELDGIGSRLNELEAEKRDLEQRSLQLQTKIELWTRVCSDLEEDENKGWAELSSSGGIQECCYRVLVEEAEPLSALSIRKQLELRGVNLDHYANPLAVIHTSLKRIPDRVRTFKQMVDLGNSVNAMRFYEAIKPASKEASSAE